MNADLRRIIKTKDDIAAARKVIVSIENELSGIKEKVVVGSMIKVVGLRDIFYPVTEKGSNHVIVDVGSSKMRVVIGNIIKIKEEN